MPYLNIFKFVSFVLKQPIQGCNLLKQEDMTLSEMEINKETPSKYVA